ncbi:MAG: STAS domain-containing protein [Actinomycetota bacterium]
MSFARPAGLYREEDDEGRARLAAPEQSRATQRCALPPRPDPNAIVLVISGLIARTDIAALCERVRVLLERSDADLIVCDVGGVVDPDAVSVDALARLQLTARGLGRRLQVRHACDQLQELLALTGLRGVLPLHAGLLREPWGETEEREQTRGVEEEADPGDPPG